MYLNSAFSPRFITSHDGTVRPSIMLFCFTSWQTQHSCSIWTPFGYQNWMYTPYVRGRLLGIHHYHKVLVHPWRFDGGFSIHTQTFLRINLSVLCTVQLPLVTFSLIGICHSWFLLSLNFYPFVVDSILQFVILFVSLYTIFSEWSNIFDFFIFHQCAIILTEIGPWHWKISPFCIFLAKTWVTGIDLECTCSYLTAYLLIWQDYIFSSFSPVDSLTIEVNFHTIIMQYIGL